MLYWCVRACVPCVRACVCVRVCVCVCVCMYVFLVYMCIPMSICNCRYDTQIQSFALMSGQSSLAKEVAAMVCVYQLKTSA